MVACTKEICAYLYETYGRFPAHVSAFYTPAMGIQFMGIQFWHLEFEYYEAFADPGFFEGQREHEAVWHGNGHAP